jgi:hypothetical protein
MVSYSKEIEGAVVKIYFASEVRKLLYVDHPPGVRITAAVGSPFLFA